MLPLNIVEKEGFRQMVKVFDSRYQLTSRNYFSHTAIPTLYTNVRDHVIEDLHQAHFFSATTDLWSSVGIEPYISFTIHYIDDSWKLRSKCLQTLFMPQDHTGLNIASVLRETVKSWKQTEEQLVCLTSDSGSNVVKAADELEWTRLSCFGHNLHNAVNNSIKDDARVSRATGVCKKIVGSFSHSWKKQRELARLQAELSLPSHSLFTVSHYLLAVCACVTCFYTIGLCYQMGIETQNDQTDF